MRMVDYPVGLSFKTIRPLNGPDVIGATVSQEKFGQSVHDPFGGLAQFEVTFPPMRSSMARAFSRLSGSAYSGANCFRFNFFDPDEPGWDEIGNSDYEHSSKVTWSNGQKWAHGQPWIAGKPIVPVTVSSANGAGSITLDVSEWNGVVPSFFGIIGHFAIYRTIGVVENGNEATVRVWPPVRKAVTTTDFATMRPTCAMRVASPDGAPFLRDVAVMDGAQLTMAEVPDEVVRKYVTEDYPA